jgi:hypothetical protein
MKLTVNFPLVSRDFQIQQLCVLLCSAERQLAP